MNDSGHFFTLVPLSDDPKIENVRQSINDGTALRISLKLDVVLSGSSLDVANRKPFCLGFVQWLRRSSGTQDKIVHSILLSESRSCFIQKSPISISQDIYTLTFVKLSHVSP